MTAEARPRWTITLTAGAEGFSGACSLVVQTTTGEAEPWFLFPGFFYGQGRTDETRATPRLAPLDLARWDSPSWDFALDRASHPVLLVRTDDRWLGLDWSPHYESSMPGDGAVQWGDAEPQIGAGFSFEAGRVELRLNFPANERPRRFARNRYDAATERKLCLAAGQKLCFQVGCWDFIAGAHGYARVLQTVYEELRVGNPSAPDEPRAELAEAAAHGLKAWHWNDGPGTMVYSVPFDRTAESIANAKGASLGWHAESVGFAGGFPVAFGLLWYAVNYHDKVARAIAERLVERYCREAQTPWGFFRTSYHPGRAQTPNGTFPNPAPAGVANPDASGDTPFYGSWWIEDQALVHARTTADASLYLARCLTLLGPEHPHYATWRQCLRRSLETALSVQTEDGRYGQLYDVVNQCVAQHEGCGGLLWIVAFHHAAPLFEEDGAFQARLESSMRRAGEGYAEDVKNECIYGGPEDVALTPTSEDGYNAVMAYAALHRRFRDERDLALLRSAADWTVSWRKAYNVRFHRKSVLHPFRTAGGDYASSQNNHLHIYGLNCLADFQYLSEVTNNAYYAKRAEDHFRFAAQLLCTTDGHWNGQRGMCSEQFYVSDWSVWGEWDPTPHHVQKGTLCGFSAVWCVNMILLGLEQQQ